MKTIDLISNFEKMLEKKLKSIEGDGPWGSLENLQPIWDWCEIHKIRPFWTLYKCVQFFDKENELIVRLSVPTPKGPVDLHFIVPLEFAEKVVVLGGFPEGVSS